ncbi:MAG TPA: hypothetical protein PLW34_08010 [Termitinemataceae bacterium]|nr:hypothetical protein [Termitinemataceae bacterium]HOM23724.1 hypothetical protein [Termitinemataceae bacterium]HPQ00763.1 hypothetical protein [Termitinemataceae bacterium]
MKDLLQKPLPFFSGFVGCRKVWKNAGVIFLVLMVLSFGSCKKGESDGPVLQTPPPQKTLRDFFGNRAEPRCFSYGTPLGNRVPVVRSLEFPPLPRDLENRGPHIAYGYGDRYEVRDQRILEAYPLVDAPVEDSPGPKEPQDPVSSSNSPGGDPAEKLPSMENLVYEATPRFQWESPYRITAGPLVFADTVLLWTARPSCVILDRISGRLVREIPLSYYVAGFESFTEGQDELLLIHGDHSLGYYVLQEESPGEEGAKTEAAFTEILGPAPEARRKIEQKVATLLSRPQVPLDRTYLFPARDDPDPLNPRLFRWDCPEAGSYMLSVEPPKGGNVVSCMMALFNGSGEFLFSNLEYEAASRFEFSRGGPESLYFVVAFMDFPGEGPERGRNTPGLSEKPVSESSTVSGGGWEEVGRGFRIVLRKR